jgi:hypothetical protein
MINDEEHSQALPLDDPGRRLDVPRPAWQTSANGNSWAKLGPWRCVICEDRSRAGRFRYLTAKGDLKGEFATTKFDSDAQARIAAWDALLKLNGF